MKYLLPVLIVFLLSCSTNKILEQRGDKALKTQNHQRTNYYLGIGESQTGFDDALVKATAAAQTMIVNELGVDVKVSTTDIMRSYDITSQDRAVSENWVASLTQRVIRLESEHNIQIKIHRLYYEKTQSSSRNKGEFTYKVWVDVYFDRDDFFTGYHQFWNDAIRDLPTNENIDRNILTFERLLSLKDRYEHEKQYLPQNIVRSLDEFYASYRYIINMFKENIVVQNIANDQSFSKYFQFKFTYKSTNQPLADCPININDRLLSTDRQGLINYEADYQTPIDINIGHNLKNYLNTQIYRNDQFSPYQNRNVAIRINSTENTLRQTIETLLANREYRIANTADIALEIIPTHTTRAIAPNQYITELKIRIDIKRNNQTRQTIYMPRNRNENIRGQGNTQKQAQENAFSLQWHGQKNQDIELIETTIREILSR